MSQNQEDQKHNINIDNIATLARIHLTQPEKVDLLQRLDSILDYCDQLSEINIEEIEASAHAFPIYDVLREDQPGPAFDANTILRNAPKQINNYIIVPKIIE